MSANPKWFSVRMWWSVSGMVVFVGLSLQGKLPLEWVTGMLSTLAYAYFTRSDRKANQ